MLKGQLPRVIYHQVYEDSNDKALTPALSLSPSRSLSFSLSFSLPLSLSLSLPLSPSFSHPLPLSPDYVFFRDATVAAGGCCDGGAGTVLPSHNLGSEQDRIGPAISGLSKTAVHHTSLACPQKALCGGIPGAVLEPLVRFWSHFLGIYRQNLTRSLEN